jgi:hypothetical protein
MPSFSYSRYDNLRLLQFTVFKTGDVYCIDSIFYYFLIQEPDNSQTIWRKKLIAIQAEYFQLYLINNYISFSKWTSAVPIYLQNNVDE